VSEWPQRVLGEVCEIVGGGTPSRTRPDYFGGPITWATPTDVTALASMDLACTSESISELGLRESSAKLLPVGTVLLTSRATIGFTAIARVPLATNQGFANFICGPDVLPEYLAHWLPTRKAEMLRHAGGTTFKEISKGALKRFTIPLPPIEEQRRIAAALDRAARLVKLHERAAVKTRDLIPALFIEMFGDPATNSKSWPLRPFGDFVSSSRYGPRFPDRAYVSGGVPVLRTTDIGHDGSTTWENAPRLDLTPDEIEKYSVVPRTLLVTRTGATIGKVALFNGYEEPCVAGAYLIEFVLSAQIEGRFALEFFRSAYGQSRLVGGGRAVAQPNLNAPTVKGIELPLPPFDKQVQFASHASRTDGLVRDLVRSHNKAVELQHGLLFDVFGAA